MSNFRMAFVLALLSTGCSIRAAKPDRPRELLRLTQVIPLDGVEGRIDHFGFDAKSQRLFVAALGNNTVEVIDLAAGKVVRQVTGVAAPQGIAFAAGSNRLAVANDEDGSCRFYDGTSLRQAGSIDLNDDADNVRYEANAQRFWVGYGEGGLAAIDALGRRKVADVKLDGHPESFQLESRGKRIFVNVPHAGYVAVVDREKLTVVAKWPVRAASANFPMALDETHHCLFIGCRQPAKLLVLDTENGNTVASINIVGDTDDLWYDDATKRIYVTGGEGHITIIGRANPDSYAVLGGVATAPGARTSFFVPNSRTLYVAVPRRGDRKAELRVFKAGESK